MKKLLPLCLFVGLLSFFGQPYRAFSQKNPVATQTIKGQIKDLNSNYPLIGATVVLVNSDPLIGSTSDVNGNFVLENVPVGRQTIKISYLGYNERIIPNILVMSGKQNVLNINLEEAVLQGEEVVITAEKEGAKGQAINEMAMVSGRSFDIEQTLRYAGSRNDPARMVTNFAGVSGANDSRNDIIVRGNSPTGILWRLDGIDIPNPNHFGAVGATGGPVSMLNNNVLNNSDFLTGAFPAQYGNANSGVFDLKMRAGNKDKFEGLGQIGFNGFELGLEGPISKAKRSSYLVNYRYSVLGVVSALGVDFGTGAAIPQYQDLTFKIDMPTGKANKLSVFGIAGTSYIELLSSQADTSDANLYSQGNEDTYFGSDMGVVGLNYLTFFTPDFSGELLASASYASSQTDQDTLDFTTRLPAPQFKSNTAETRYRLGYTLNKKYNARNTVQAGVYNDVLGFNYDEAFINSRSGVLETEIKDKGYTFLQQSFLQWKLRFTNTLTIVSGVHSQYLAVNNQLVAEPRLGLDWAFRPGQSLSFGAGIHHQMQPLQIYFVENENPAYNRSNKDLKFVRSGHFVAGYNRMLSENLRFKTEAYYQQIDQAAVTAYPSSFSLLNSGADFGLPTLDSLTNDGRGQNIGLELTLERYYEKGYYFLVTGSLFDSQYKASDGQWRNTAFNGNFVGNVLAGKEFSITDRLTLGFDVKTTLAGGRRITPLDETASVAQNQLVVVEERAYEEQVTNYFRTDFKVSLRYNAKKVSHEFYVDLQNVTNNQNVFDRAWDTRTRQAYEVYQIGFFPNVQYRVTF